MKNHDIWNTMLMLGEWSSSGQSCPKQTFCFVPRACKQLAKIHKKCFQYSPVWFGSTWRVPPVLGSILFHIKTSQIDNFLVKRAEIRRSPWYYSCSRCSMLFLQLPVYYRWFLPDADRKIRNLKLLILQHCTFSILLTSMSIVAWHIFALTRVRLFEENFRNSCWMCS